MTMIERQPITRRELGGIHRELHHWPHCWRPWVRPSIYHRTPCWWRLVQLRRRLRQIAGL